MGEKIEEILLEEQVSALDKPGQSPSMLPLSIIAGSLIIAGSILYAAKIISQSGIPPFSESPQQQAAANAVVPVQDRTGAPVIGNPAAKVSMVEFADFQCPFCEKFYSQTFASIKSKYIDTGKVKLIFRHFPLTNIHQNAMQASLAAECANLQGKFEGYHDMLFSQGKADGSGLDAASLKKYAQNLKLNTADFNSCLDSKQTAAAVNSDVQAGTASGVNGTPTFFINGTKIVGAEALSTFEKAIDLALQ